MLLVPKAHMKDMKDMKGMKKNSFKEVL